MNVGKIKEIRMVIAPLALGMTVGVGAARVAGAQTPPPSTPPPSQPTQPAQPATQPAQPAQTQQQAQPPEEATFSAPAGMLLIQIKPDQTAQFEMLMGRLKEALAKSEKPERRKMAEGWRVYKAAEPMGANALFIFLVDPVDPTQKFDYQNVFRVIAEVFPTEVQDLYAKTKDSFVGSGIGRLNLTLLQNFGTGGAAAPAASVPPKQ